MIEKMYKIGKIYFASFFSFVTMILLTNIFFNEIINASVVIVFFLISFVIGRAITDRKLKNLLITMISLLLISLFGFFLFYFIRDISVDGNTYHLEVILELFKGTNLFFHSFDSIWLDYYPKTIEILFSGFSSFFNNYDIGRIFKIFLIVLSFINVFYFLKKITKDKIKWQHVFIVVIIVLNPVVIYQFFTLYIDDVLYLFLINFIIYFFLGETKVGLLILALLISSKISYLLFGGLGLITVLYIKSIYNKEGLWKTINNCYKNISSKKTIRALFIVLILVIGLHQYIINTYKYKNPLYGFLGEGKKDIISMFQPPMMENKNKISKFIYTYFSYSRNYCITCDCQKFISLKDKEGIKEFFLSYKALGIYDPNLNGFGNIYSILLIFSSIYTIYLIWALVKRKNKDTSLKKIYLVLLGYILICTFLLPFPRARYWPLLYLLPLIIFCLDKNRLIKVILFLYVINVFLVSGIIGAIYSRNGFYKIKQNISLHKMEINEIYFTKFLPDTLLYKKFFGFYSKEVKNKNIKEIKKEELLNKCGIKTYEEIIKSYNQTLICPNGGSIIRGDYGSHVEEFFYIK